MCAAAETQIMRTHTCMQMCNKSRMLCVHRYCISNMALISMELCVRRVHSQNNSTLATFMCALFSIQFVRVCVCMCVCMCASYKSYTNKHTFRSPYRLRHHRAYIIVCVHMRVCNIVLYSSSSIHAYIVSSTGVCVCVCQQQQRAARISRARNVNDRA